MIAKLRYLLYGTSIILVMILISPVFILRPLSPKNSHLFFKVYAWVAKHFINFHVHIEGKEIIENNRPGILIGNHQHNYDVITVSKLYTDFVVVLGKFELGLIPLFGQIYVLGGNILVKRGNRKKALQSMDKLEKKINKDKLTVLVFPEGHRNKNKELLPFKKGAYYTALKTQVPLIPFSVSQFVQEYAPFKGFERIDVYIKVHQPISVSGKTIKDIPELIQKSRSVIEQGIVEMNQKYQ